MKNYTTSINAHKSKSEIEQFLARNGASKIMTEYDDKGNPISLKFQITAYSVCKDLYYNLPCRVDGIHTVLQQKKEAKYRTYAHALNVAWRILKEWVEIQMSLIEADMATIDEVFLPYMVVNENETLYDKFLINNTQKLLSN